MQNRAKVICHMITSINGNAVTGLLGDPKLSAASDLYSRQVLDFGSAWGCGRSTFQKTASSEIDLSKYKGVPVTYEDKTIPSPDGRYCVAFDRFGKLFWDTDIGPYWGGKLIEVLTKQAAPEFLAYLDEKNIAYMFAGDTDFEPEVFLEKLKAQYSVDTFVLAGGPTINGIFMKENLIDEVNLVITAGVDGQKKAVSFAGVDELNGFPKYFQLQEASQHENNVANLRYVRL